MTYCCPQCSFTAQFESALLMHRQLHHEANDFPDLSTPNLLLEKSKTVPQVSPPRSPVPACRSKDSRLLARTSSATRLFNNLKARICKSKALFSHPVESPNQNLNFRYTGSPPSGCTSKGMKVDSIVSSSLTTCLEDRETFGCHLCPFEADRITVLDRHLLNHHKIGLDNLLKLVMAKTKHGLADDNAPCFGIRQPYYKISDEVIDEGEFIIETIAPKIKILKHTSTNTEHAENSIDDFKAIASEIENLFMTKQNGDQVVQDSGFLSKMATLNECMCKFVDSSNTLKKVLNKEMDSKADLRDHLSGNEPIFNLGLGDREPREWERAHSEKMERSRKHSEKSRGERGKMSTSESFYF